MTKNELRVWCLRTHSPDEWWVEVDGTVVENPVSLDEAFRRAEEAAESFIIHASHAEETDKPHWIKMGEDAPVEDSFGLPKWVCKKCTFSFEDPRLPKPSLVEVVGYVLIVPGVLLARKRKSRKNASCPHCGANHLVPGNSRAGKALLSR